MSKIKTINASFFIVGTSIGAGMLGLPVETGRGGFLPALFFLVVNWALMSATALLFVELLATYKHNANFITLSEKILGQTFKIVTFFVYNLLFMSLTFAYVKGGGVFLSDFFSSLPISAGCFIFLAFSVPLIVLGSSFLSFGNTIFTFALIVAFFGLVSLGITKVNYSLLEYSNWTLGLLSYPLFITSFGFHSVLPSLYSYLQDKKSLRIAVVLGTSMTFLIYLVWELIVMGIVPLQGENSLIGALSADQTAITPLKAYITSPLFTICAQTFYFTALLTSFLGVGLGLIDFLLDSFRIKQNLFNRFLFSLFIYLPALLLAQTDLGIFYLSLKYGGGISCFYLLIFLPILLFIQSKRTSSAVTNTALPKSF